MGKETKIGLAILGVLFVGLIAAAGWRFTRTASAAPEKPAAEAPKVKLPAVAPVTILSSTGGAPPLKPSESDRWTAPVRTAGNAAAVSLPPSYMPPAPSNTPVPTPSTGDRYGLSTAVGSRYAAPTNLPSTPITLTADTRPASPTLLGGAAVPPTATTAVAPPPAAPLPVEPVAPAAPMTGYSSSSAAMTPAPTRYSYPPTYEPSAAASPSLGTSRLANAGVPDAGGGLRRTEPARRPDGTYKVQPNDSFWVISEKLYGAGVYFKALTEANRHKFEREDRLQVGMILVAPTVAELEQKFPDLCPKASHVRPAAAAISSVSVPASQYGGRRMYTVSEGDTLFDIARDELGKASRWAEIYELNRDRLGEDCDYLAPGTKLVLPEAAAGDRIAERPGGTLR